MNLMGFILQSKLEVIQIISCILTNFFAGFGKFQLLRGTPASRGLLSGFDLVGNFLQNFFLCEYMLAEYHNIQNL